MFARSVFRACFVGTVLLTVTAAYAKEGDQDKPIADHTDPIRLKPDDFEAYYKRGVAYCKEGDLDKAITDYTEAIRLKPDFADAYRNRSVAYDKKGDKENASNDLARAKELENSRK